MDRSWRRDLPRFVPLPRWARCWRVRPRWIMVTLARGGDVQPGPPSATRQRCQPLEAGLDSAYARLSRPQEPVQVDVAEIGQEAEQLVHIGVQQRLVVGFGHLTPNFRCLRLDPVVRGGAPRRRPPRRSAAQPGRPRSEYLTVCQRHTSCYRRHEVNSSQIMSRSVPAIGVDQPGIAIEDVAIMWAHTDVGVLLFARVYRRFTPV